MPRYSLIDSLITITIAIIVWLIIALAVTSVVVEDKIKYCRIVQIDQRLYLYGIRDYRIDVTIKQIESVEEGTEVARKLGCRLETDESNRPSAN